MSLPKTKAQSPSPSVEALPLLDRGISTQNPDRFSVPVSDSEQSGERATLIAVSELGSSTTDTNIDIDNDMDIDIEAQQEQRQQHQQQSQQRQSKRPEQRNKSRNTRSDGCGCGCLAAILGAIFGVVAVVSVVAVLLVFVCNVCGVDSSGKQGDKLNNVGFVQSQTSKEKSTSGNLEQVDQDIVGVTSNDHTETNTSSDQATRKASNQQSKSSQGNQKEDEYVPPETEKPSESGRSNTSVTTKPNRMKPTSTKNQQKQKEKAKHNPKNTRLSSGNGRGAEGKRAKPKSAHNGTNIDSASGLEGGKTSNKTGLIGSSNVIKKTPGQSKTQRKPDHINGKSKEDKEDKKIDTTNTKVVNGNREATEAGNEKLKLKQQELNQQVFSASGSIKLRHSRSCAQVFSASGKTQSQLRAPVPIKLNKTQQLDGSGQQQMEYGQSQQVDLVNEVDINDSQEQQPELVIENDSDSDSDSERAPTFQECDQEDQGEDLFIMDGAEQKTHEELFPLHYQFLSVKLIEGEQLKQMRRGVNVNFGDQLNIVVCKKAGLKSVPIQMKDIQSASLKKDKTDSEVLELTYFQNIINKKQTCVLTFKDDQQGHSEQVLENFKNGLEKGLKKIGKALSEQGEVVEESFEK